LKKLHALFIPPYTIPQSGSRFDPDLDAHLPIIRRTNRNANRNAANKKRAASLSGGIWGSGRHVRQNSGNSSVYSNISGISNFTNDSGVNGIEKKMIKAVESFIGKRMETHPHEHREDMLNYVMKNLIHPRSEQT
jgi:hypothetical protein